MYIGDIICGYPTASQACAHCDCVKWDNERIIACNKCDFDGHGNFNCCAMLCPHRASVNMEDK